MTTRPWKVGDKAKFPKDCPWQYEVTLLSNPDQHPDGKVLIERKWKTSHPVLVRPARLERFD